MPVTDSYPKKSLKRTVMLYLLCMYVYNPYKQKVINYLEFGIWYGYAYIKQSITFHFLLLFFL